MIDSSLPPPSLLSPPSLLPPFPSTPFPLPLPSPSPSQTAVSLRHSGGCDLRWKGTSHITPHHITSHITSLTSHHITHHITSCTHYTHITYTSTSMHENSAYTHAYILTHKMNDVTVQYNNMIAVLCCCIYGMCVLQVHVATYIYMYIIVGSMQLGTCAKCSATSKADVWVTISFHGDHYMYVYIHIQMNW